MYQFRIDDGKTKMIDWTRKTRNLRPIGLDIGHSSVKMIQLVNNDGEVKVLAADKVRIDESIDGNGEERRDFIISAIKQMLAKGSFRGREVVSCLPNDILKITSLRLSETESEKIDQALRKEAFQRFGMDQDNVSIDYALAGDVRHGDEIKSELILFAADNEEIKNHMKMLEKAGLRPEGIDPVPCALFRCFRRLLRRQEDKSRSYVFVDVGNKFTTIVFVRGGEISFVKQIPIGGARFNEEIAGKLDLSVDEAMMLRCKLQMQKLPDGEQELQDSDSDSTKQASQAETEQERQDDGALDASTQQVIDDAINVAAEQLAREISLCFKYYTVTFRGKRVDRAFFCGGEAYENTLLDILRRKLSVDIEVAQPLRGFILPTERSILDFHNDKQRLFCEWAVAVGLTLKGWEKMAYCESL